MVEPGLGVIYERTCSTRTRLHPTSATAEAGVSASMLERLGSPPGLSVRCAGHIRPRTLRFASPDFPSSTYCSAVMAPVSPPWWAAGSWLWPGHRTGRVRTTVLTPRHRTQRGGPSFWCVRNGSRRGSPGGPCLRPFLVAACNTSDGTSPLFGWCSYRSALGWLGWRPGTCPCVSLLMATYGLSTHSRPQP